MNSQAARFFLYEKWFKSWKKAEKKGKIKRKKLQIFFCLGASTWRDEMPLIKVAYLMLNFLNLKSFLSNLFFAVASSLSTLWFAPNNYWILEEFQTVKRDGFGSLSGFFLEFIKYSATIYLYDKILTRENDQNTKDVHSIIYDVIIMSGLTKLCWLSIKKLEKQIHNKYIDVSFRCCHDVIR